VSWFRSSLRRRREREEGSGADPAREAGAAVATASEVPEEAHPPLRRSELNGRPLADLHELARERGVPRYRLLRREQLVVTLIGGGPADVGAEAPQDDSAPPASIEVSEETSGSVELLEAVQHLVHELSSSASAPGASDLEEIVGSPAARLLVARDGERQIVGMLTLATFRTPTGLRAWIEDVVVAESARGRGAGEALTREALRLAAEAGARTVDLTSRRERQAANRMYRKLGFERRETSVYRFQP
jgi:ribosomal protein S18 acetylase RimI-like enzyme